jgi:hypothetical protein
MTEDKRKQILDMLDTLQEFAIPESGLKIYLREDRDA